MGDFPQDFVDEIKKDVREEVKRCPIAEKVGGHHMTLYGDDGRGGIVGWSNQINGNIKAMKWILGIGLTVIGGINAAILTAVLSHIAK